MNKFLRLNINEIGILSIKFILVVALLDIVYYRSLNALIILIPVGVLYIYNEYQELLDKKRNQICIEFKEFMLLSVTGLRAGYSVENAMINTKKDIKSLFGENSSICLLVNEIKTAKLNHKPIAKIFNTMGELTSIDDIKDFAQVYEIAYKGSGNINNVMEKCAAVIVDKLEIRNDIYLSLSEKIFEMKIMCIMPYMIVGYISLTSPGYFNVMYSDIKGRIIMTINLLIYVVAYCWSKRLISIDV